MAYLIKSKSFLYFYKAEVEDKIKKIDLALKETADGISPKKGATLLNVTLREIQSALYSKGAKKITKENIAEIMLSLDSPICNIFKRAMECGFPSFYCAENLAYIYNIDQKAVQNAFDFLDIRWAREEQLPAVFAQIFEY